MYVTLCVIIMYGLIIYFDDATMVDRNRLISAVKSRTITNIPCPWLSLVLFNFVVSAVIYVNFDSFQLVNSMMM